MADEGCTHKRAEDKVVAQRLEARGVLDSDIPGRRRGNLPERPIMGPDSFDVQRVFTGGCERAREAQDSLTKGAGSDTERSQ